MSDEDALVLLDAEDKSLSVAQARHLARAKMLIPALDNLFEIGLNVTVKPGDRVTALKEIIKFASEAQGEGTKTVDKLSPEAARLLIKLGAASDQLERSSTGRRRLPREDGRGVVPYEKSEERVGAGNGSADSDREGFDVETAD